MTLLENTELLREWYYIVEDMCNEKVVLPENPLLHISDRKLSMGLVSYDNLRRMNVPSNFHEKYLVMFINDYEPYAQKVLYPMMMICDNENVDRSVIALRLLYEDKQLNHLLQYGILNKNYKVYNNRVELLKEPYNIFNWWNSIVNYKYSYSMIYEPEDAEKYVADLYLYQKQVIPGISASNLSKTYIKELVYSDHMGKEALMQRENFILNKLYFYKNTILEGMPYELLIRENLEVEKQNRLLEIFREHIDGLRNEPSPIN